jgi:hypothetical protein
VVEDSQPVVLLDLLGDTLEHVGLRSKLALMLSVTPLPHISLMQALICDQFKSF